MRTRIRPFNVVALALGVLLATSSQAAVPLDGLVAYYPFNGNANDVSGNGNNGVVFGATLTSDRFGIADSAYYFGGNGHYILVAPSASQKWTPKFGPEAKLDFSGSAGHEKTAEL